ncbi:MAG: hypothetical protein NT038_05730 [Euryarchaeota archaeon]|nr:hypothetical protein [Euryarchaeota archaeon]
MNIQTVKSTQVNIVDSFEPRFQKLVDALSQKGFSHQMKATVPKDQYVQLLKDMFDSKTENKMDLRFSKILNVCSAFHSAVDTGSNGRILFVLFLTIVIEFFVYLATVQSPPLALLFLSIVINGITNPLVNFVYYFIYNNVFVLETIVFLVEIVMIFILFNALSVEVSLPKAVLISLLANLFSYIFATGITKLVYDVSPAST